MVLLATVAFTGRRLLAALCALLRNVNIALHCTRACATLVVDQVATPRVCLFSVGKKAYRKAADTEIDCRLRPFSLLERETHLRRRRGHMIVGQFI